MLFAKFNHIPVILFNLNLLNIEHSLVIFASELQNIKCDCNI